MTYFAAFWSESNSKHCLIASFCAKLVARRPPLALAPDSHCHGRTLFPNNSLQKVRMRTF
jgi:hypothetical protein